MNSRTLVIVSTFVAASALGAHVAEDEINHRGQIRWLRARLGSPATLE